MSSTTVHILLATFNGSRFLGDQLTSIARQTHTSWRLTVSDDGSDDHTLQIIEAFAQSVEQPVTLIRGPGKGATLNFFHLIAQTHADSNEELFAFADQDDVWLENKLARAVHWHERHTHSAVRLYCGRTRYVDESLRLIGESRRLRRQPDLRNALVQNIASGNTMVFNVNLLDALQAIEPDNSIFHDWTTYLVATALDGEVYFDNLPTVLYRQHGANVIGSNEGLMAQIRRLRPVCQGRYKYWAEVNLKTMVNLASRLPASTQAHLENFQRMRGAASWRERIRCFINSGIRRQSLPSNVLLFMAVLFKMT